MTDVLIRSSLSHPDTRPLLEGLLAESTLRYGDVTPPSAKGAELSRYPEALFTPPLGTFLLLQRSGRTIAGGAFMSHDDETVEIKRIWTDPALRRQGLANAIMTALEKNAAELGYTRAYLTTGFRQPEAVALYRSLGYRPLFDLTADLALYRSLPFEKHIGARNGEAGTSPVHPPAASFEAAYQRVRDIKDAQEAQILSRLARFEAASAA